MSGVVVVVVECCVVGGIVVGFFVVDGVLVLSAVAVVGAGSETAVVFACFFGVGTVRFTFAT